jgi:hypothetical protein
VAVGAAVSVAQEVSAERKKERKTYARCQACVKGALARKAPPREVSEAARREGGQAACTAARTCVLVCVRVVCHNTNAPPARPQPNHAKSTCVCVCVYVIWAADLRRGARRADPPVPRGRGGAAGAAGLRRHGASRVRGHSTHNTHSTAQHAQHGTARHSTRSTAQHGIARAARRSAVWHGAWLPRSCAASEDCVAHGRVRVLLSCAH